jgi:tetratricopeptide (TPR) repeat protein
VGDNGGFTLAAAASLARAPDDRRDALLEIILGPRPGVAAGMLGADLLVRWDRPEEAWALLDGTLPEDDPAAMGVLRRFAESAGQLGTIAGFRARGYALERLAARLNGAEALRTRTEAARSFAEAGDAQSAQRLLSRRSRERMVDARDEAAAMATLIRVWIDAGRLEDAEARLGEWRDRLSGDDLAALRERLAWRWVVRAELDRAERWMGDDSTVGMRAIRGWVALYRGNIAEAKALFRSAGPYAQSREEATRRAHMLVQLERIEAERIPALGEALLVLARGDSAAAVRQLRRVAERLPPRGGRAELLTMTGELASALGDADTAEEALEQALAADSLGPVAPAAEYALAVLYVERGRNPEAVARLEHLILTYGESAVVPQARRLLDQIRGTIPRS